MRASLISWTLWIFSAWVLPLQSYSPIQFLIPLQSYSPIQFLIKKDKRVDSKESKEIRKRCKVDVKNSLCTKENYKDKFVFYSIQYKNGWLAASDFFDVLTQLSSIKHRIITYYDYRCLKNIIHQIDSKNEWLLLQGSLTIKIELVFVLTLENAFS